MGFVDDFPMKNGALQFWCFPKLWWPDRQHLREPCPTNRMSTWIVDPSNLASGGYPLLMLLPNFKHLIPKTFPFNFNLRCPMLWSSNLANAWHVRFAESSGGGAHLMPPISAVSTEFARLTSQKLTSKSMPCLRLRQSGRCSVNLGHGDALMDEKWWEEWEWETYCYTKLYKLYRLYIYIEDGSLNPLQKAGWSWMMDDGQ
jgi:hypothetical protein